MNFLLSLVILGVISSIVAQSTCPRCTPLCKNGDGSDKLCGDDGCGGSCGSCPFGQQCCRGVCTCAPNCAGRSCGDDGCGGISCGSCSSTQTCSNGVCVGTAQPSCNNRQCGNNRAGGSCGSCPAGQRCRAGVCECYYDCNERNCGNAPQPDGTNTGLCPQRSCGSCPSGFTCGSNGMCSILSPCNVTITVVDCSTRQRISTSSSVRINSTSLSYTATVTVSAGSSYSWTTPGIGAFTFQTTATGYVTNTQDFTLTASTTAVELCVTPAPIPVRVVDCTTNQAISSTATVTITTSSLSSYRGSLTVASGASASWSFPGYYQYSFVTSASGYVSNTQSFTVTSTTSSITACVNPSTLQIDVRDEATNITINVGATIHFSGAAQGSFRWNGVTTWRYTATGFYTFEAMPDSRWDNGTTSLNVNSAVTFIIIYVKEHSVCPNDVCDPGETATSCPDDCVSIFFEYENADGSGPVNGPTVNYFLANPRDANGATGPNRNTVQAITTRTTGNGSNTVLEETYSYHTLVWIETVAAGFINFYWTANTSQIDAGLGVYRLRVHLSTLLTSTSLNYRFVNTWRPIDADPAPYAPTDLNLHSFHPSAALDINHPNLTVNGFLIGRSVADSKQSGGPATMDISPSAGTMIAIWNSKPPRSNVIAPSQNSRFIVDSGSYVVFYGKTSNAASGKQLGEVVMNDIFITNPNQKNDRSSDLWYVAQFTVSQPALDQPKIVGQAKFKKGTTDSNKNLIFDCEAYSYCQSFVVPYSDTGR